MIRSHPPLEMGRQDMFLISEVSAITTRYAMQYHYDENLLVLYVCTVGIFIHVCAFMCASMIVQM